MLGALQFLLLSAFINWGGSKESNQWVSSVYDRFFHKKSYPYFKSNETSKYDIKY